MKYSTSLQKLIVDFEKMKNVLKHSFSFYVKGNVFGNNFSVMFLPPQFFIGLLQELLIHKVLKLSLKIFLVARNF